MDLTAWTEAQRAVIGSLLIDPDHCAGEIFQKARPEQFRDGALLHVFEAARGLWLERKPIDAVTVLDAAGDSYRQLLADCMNSTPTVVNLPAYLEILRSSARFAAMQRCAAEILSAGTEAEAAELYEQLGEELRAGTDVEDLSWAQCVGRYLDRMGDKAPADYLHWGLKPLDRVLQVPAGKFVIIGADSSVGKTALALQLAYHMAKTGRRVGFFSLETDTESLTDRLMAEAQVAGISIPRTKQKALSTADYEKAAEIGVESDKLPLRIINRAETVEQIRSLTVQHGFDVIFIDYLQLIDAPGEKRWDIVTGISMRLHRMAQRLKVTVVALSQITPPEKGAAQRLTMDDLRESRQLKHDADVILLLTPDKGFPGARRLTIAKNKDGKRQQAILLHFDAEHMTFREATRSQIQAVTGQVKLQDLPDEEGGELPF